MKLGPVEFFHHYNLGVSMDSELKRKKVRLTAEDEGDEEQDRISRLSDDLIHIIMSFLDIKLSVQTCILSKRWKLVWTTLPFLKFRSYYSNSPKYKSSIPQTTPKFVEEFIKHRNHGSQIWSLKLMLLTPALFTKFVGYAISHHVQCLNGHLKSGLYELSMFNSNSIRTLKLKMKFQDVELESNCWDLPNLTTLHLTRVHYDRTHNLPGLCLTCLPALKTLCLTNWYLERSFFSLSLPGLTTLRLSNCTLPIEDWNFPALNSLVLHDVLFPWNMREMDMFSALVSLRNLTLFFYKTSTQDCVLSCPQLVNLEIRTRYHNKNIGCIKVSAPKLCNFTSVGIFSIRFEKHKLDNVYIKLRGWIDHMILPPEKLKECYKQLTSMLSQFGTAKNLHLDLETIEALSFIADDLIRSPPFLKLKYVKLPLGCEERNICSSLRSYLLGGSPTANMVTAWPQNMIPNSAPAHGTAQNVTIQEPLATPTKNMIPNLVPAETAQNVVIQEPLAAPTMVYFDSENINVSIDTVDIGVQEQDVVGNSEVRAHKVRHVVAPVGGTGNDRASSSKEISDFGIWRGYEVKSEFVCLLDLIMDKYPETFEHYTTKIKKFCTMELNMLCSSINDFTKVSMANVDIEVIAEYKAVFAELQKYGFSVSWLENRLNYVEKLRFSQPLIHELGAIDRHIDDTKSKLQDLQTKLQDLKTIRAEKMQEIQNAFGTLGANIAVGYIGDDLFSV